MQLLAKLMSYLPAILQGVIAVEAVIHVPGATKKQMVLGAVTAAAQAGETISDPEISGISALIDHTVTTLNNSGVFGHGDAAQAAAQKVVTA